MNRKLVILGNTGPKGHYVDSVNYDITNYKDYFASGNGGAWDEYYEMYVPEVNTVTWNDLDRYMKLCEHREHVDLWVIVFTGHGWADENTTYLEPKPNTAPQEDIPVSWIKQMTRNSRCLLIADSCRDVLPLNEGVEAEVRCFSADESDDYKDLCRRLYDRTLIGVPVGSFCAGYACLYKQTAGNILGDKGGLYTDSLLRAASNEIKGIKATNERNTVVSFSYIHTLAKREVLRLSNNEQEPELDHDRARQIPFCVIP